MIAIQQCAHVEAKKNGKDRKGNQRYRCLDCGKTWSIRPPRPLGSLLTSVVDAAKVVHLLVEGMSIRSTERFTGIDQDTIGRIILRVGDNCKAFFDTNVQDVKSERVQLDEIWSYVGCKEKTKKAKDKGPDFGDSWTWIALDADSKLVLAYEIGDRCEYTAQKFLRKLRDAVSGRIQVTSDGLGAYTNNVPIELFGQCDFAQLIKKYAAAQQTTRYSPASIIGIEKTTRYGSPDPAHVSTSYIERFNLSVRMQNRRFTRLTNAFSKSLDHHKAMQNIHMAYHNWCWDHKTLGKKTTPAMAAGLATEKWSVERLIEKAGN